MHKTSPPGAWIRSADGLTIAQVQDDRSTLGPLHTPTPSCHLRETNPDPGTPISSLRGHEVVVVWEDKRLAHCLMENEAWARARARGDSELQENAETPGRLILGGALVDFGLFDRWAHCRASTGATDPSLFSRAYGATDRIRAPIPCHKLDVHNLYFLILSYSFQPVRSFDPGHIRSTT